MSTTLTCNEEPDVICSGTLTADDLRRFAVFDENDRFVGIKPGISSDDINPDWRSEVLKWAYVLQAIDITRQTGKADRARLIACAHLLQLVAGVFSLPHYELTDGRETLCFGQLWYLTEEEREESLNRYFDSLQTPDWWETPEAVRGINHGLAVVEAFADGLRSLQDAEKLRFVRKASIDMITTWDTLLEDRVLQDALKAILSTDKFARKRKITPDLSTEAEALYSTRHADSGRQQKITQSTNADILPIGRSLLSATTKIGQGNQRYRQSSSVNYRSKQNENSPLSGRPQN